MFVKKAWIVWSQASAKVGLVNKQRFYIRCMVQLVSRRHLENIRRSLIGIFFIELPPTFSSPIRYRFQIYKLRRMNSTQLFVRVIWKILMGITKPSIHLNGKYKLNIIGTCTFSPSVYCMDLIIHSSLFLKVKLS